MSSRGCPQITRIAWKRGDLVDFGKGTIGEILEEIFRRNYVRMLKTRDRQNFIFGCKFWDMVDTKAIHN